MWMRDVGHGPMGCWPQSRDPWGVSRVPWRVCRFTLALPCALPADIERVD